MKNYLTVFLIAVLLTGYKGNAQKISIERVNQDSPKSTIRDGIFYTLPKTILVVEVEVTKTETSEPDKKSLCDAACQKEIGIDQYTNSKSFKISNYTVSSMASQDLDQVYKVNPKKKWNKNINVALTLSEKGIIQGSEVSVEDKTLDIVTKGLSSVTSLVGKFSGMENLGGTKEHQELQNLVLARKELVASTRYGGDEGAIKFQVSELDKLIAVELERLIGKKSVKKAIFRFEIDPSCTKLPSKSSLLKVSDTLTKEGIYLDPDNRNTNILYPQNFLSSENSGKLLEVVISDHVKEDYGALINKTSASDADKKGFAYRIPKNQIVTVLFDNVPRLITEVPIAQCGSIAYLPHKIDKASVQYYENSGSLKSVSSEASSIIGSDDFGTMEGVVSGIKDLTDGSSELDNLNEENTLLEARKKNKELEEYKDQD